MPCHRSSCEQIPIHGISEWLDRKISFCSTMGTNIGNSSFTFSTWMGGDCMRFTTAIGEMVVFDFVPQLKCFVTPWSKLQEASNIKQWPSNANWLRYQNCSFSSNFLSHIFGSSNNYLSRRMTTAVFLLILHFIFPIYGMMGMLSQARRSTDSNFHSCPPKRKWKRSGTNAFRNCCILFSIYTETKDGTSLKKEHFSSPICEIETSKRFIKQIWRPLSHQKESRKS